MTGKAENGENNLNNQERTEWRVLPRRAYRTVSGILSPPLPLFLLSSKSRCVLTLFLSIAWLVPFVCIPRIRKQVNARPIAMMTANAMPAPPAACHDDCKLLCSAYTQPCAVVVQFTAADCAVCVVRHVPVQPPYGTPVYGPGQPVSACPLQRRVGKVG